MRLKLSLLSIGRRRASSIVGSNGVVSKDNVQIFAQKLQSLPNNVGQQFSQLNQQLKELTELGRSDATLHSEINMEANEIFTKMNTFLARLLNRFEGRSESVSIEFHPGAGGDEAKLFAQDLLRMYQNVAENFNLKSAIVLPDGEEIVVESLHVESNDSIDAMSMFRYEAGVHRVQRVPITCGTTKKVHTSTVGVFVNPIHGTVNDIEIHASDLEITAIRSSGPGGQNVNKINSCCSLIYKPENYRIKVQDHKQFEQNKKLALGRLKTMLSDRRRRADDDALRSDRAFQLMGLDRSDKIRTYNFKQSRVTDHRMNVSVQALRNYLDGGDAWTKLYYAVRAADAIDILSTAAEEEVESVTVQKQYLHD